MRRRRNRNNPIGLLVLAVPFFMMGIQLLFEKGPSGVVASPTYHAMNFDTLVASETMMHAGGAIGIAVGGVIVGVYFKIRYGR
jgi:hypothetical protein